MLYALSRMSDWLWATDVHLDHLSQPSAARDFGVGLLRASPDCAGLIVTGDIGEAPSVVHILGELASGFERPVHFVLGNHDFYGGSFAEVVPAVDDLCSRVSNLHWLRQGPAWLAQHVVLLGVDGWYDARNGDRNTALQLTDFVRIAELFEARDDSRQKLLATCERRADAEARLLRDQLHTVLSADRYDDGHPTQVPDEVIVATHVPPFQAAAWHAGESSNDYWAPFFSSKALGDVVDAVAEAWPRTRITVLCGHTHGCGIYRHRDNLTVFTGRARYGDPELAGVIEVGSGSVRVDLFADRRED